MTGAQLRALRRSRGLRQVDLARIIRVTANTVARWEQGRVRITPPMVRLIRMTT
jgi:DNA-binding transcriptional regulator YiaG